MIIELFIGRGHILIHTLEWKLGLLQTLISYSNISKLMRTLKILMKKFITAYQWQSTWNTLGSFVLEWIIHAQTLYTASHSSLCWCWAVLGFLHTWCLELHQTRFIKQENCVSFSLRESFRCCFAKFQMGFHVSSSLRCGLSLAALP